MSLDLNRYAGLTCQLKTMDNADVMFGEIQVKDAELRVVGAVSLENSLPLVMSNAGLKMIVYDKQGGFSILLGEVSSAEGRTMCLKKITTFKGANWSNRRHFRVDVEIATKLYSVEGRGVVPVQIKNISLTGMLVECGQILDAESHFDIATQFMGPEVPSIAAVVVRGQKMKNAMAYGLDFVDMEDWAEQKLCAFIFAKQGEQIRKRGRTRDRFER